MCLTVSYDEDDATAPLNPTDTSLFAPRDRRRTVLQAVSYVPIRSVLAEGDWTTRPIRLELAPCCLIGWTGSVRSIVGLISNNISQSEAEEGGTGTV